MKTSSSDYIYSRKAFTLIELLVVIAIISLLSSIVLASLSSAQESARDARRKQDLQQIKTALQLYKNDNNGDIPYNTTTLSSGLDCMHVATNIYLSSGGLVSPGSCGLNPPIGDALNTYMQAVPTDPLDSGEYNYSWIAAQHCLRGSSGDDYVGMIIAYLETGDSQRTFADVCPGGGLSFWDSGHNVDLLDEDNVYIILIGNNGLGS